MLLLSLFLGGVAHCQEITIFSGRTMGPIPYNIRAVLPQGVDSEDVRQKIVDSLQQVNDQMSTYVDSELRRFNRSREVDTWIEVSPATVEVVAYALELAQKSNGAFDPTVGPVVNLWGFGPDKRPPAVPSDDAIRQAFQKVGYHKVAFRNEPPALRKSHPGTELDLSALAKGYAVDIIARMLIESGCKACMVEIGGEVAAFGRKPGGQKWRIGIEQPDNLGGMRAVVPLEDSALATSGDYRNYYERDGRRYSHTIDPATGRPVKHQMATVSILASTCMEADALATTLMVMGPERGYDWARQHDVAALLVYRENNQYVERRTPAWDQSLGNGSPENRTESATKASDTMLDSENLGLYVLVAAIFGIVILAMAVGTIFTGRRLRGSCGGIAGNTDEQGNLRCSLCHDPSPDCTRQSPSQTPSREDASSPTGER
jgi:FAD:protein FMN transferase